MTETRELRSVVEAAEQAAAAGDHVAAEQLLREVALLQEASLGPLHPDLANTLNNLGVVCEITGKAADAEQFYRRAYAIATAALPPGHAFVATSEKNLREFCAARGRPLEAPQPIPAVESQPIPAAEPQPIPAAEPQPIPAAEAPREPQVAAPALLPQERVSNVDAPLPGWKKAMRSRALGFLGAYVLVLVVFVAAYRWFSADAPESSPPASATSAAQQTPAPPPEPSPVASTPAPASTSAAAPPTNAARIPAPTPAPTGAPVAERTPALPVPTAKVSGAVARPTLVAPAVADAQLCRDLTRSGDWRCDPAGSPVDPGTLFFYTRLKAASDTTVRHRWYRGERLIQAIELRVRANPGNGYRTFSRNTVNAQAAGDWRVELTAADGAVLHEVRFVVR